MSGTTTDETFTRARTRLLLVTHHYSPEHGAPQRRWDALAPRMIAQGIDMAVLTPPPHYPEGTLQDTDPAYRPGSVRRGLHGETVVRVRFRPHTSRLVSRTVDQAVAAASSVVQGLRHFGRHGARPDVVVGTVPGIPSMFAAWLLARLLGARLVIEMRDAWPDLIGPSGILATGRSPRARLLSGVRALVHRTLTHLQGAADVVVTTTETFADVLLERGVERVAVVRNGTAYQSRAEAADAPGPVDGATPSRALRVVYAGTVGRAQDLGSVVRASALLKQRGVPVDVRIVGTGAEVAPLRLLVDELDAPVSLGGQVPHDEVRRLYAWADTVVVSLRDWTPLEWTIPSKLYEVMASGSHTTACVAGEAAELVSSTGAGDVVPPGSPEALADLWTGWWVTGTLPKADPYAADWVRHHANDDALALRYVAVVRSIRDDASGPGDVWRTPDPTPTAR